MGLPPTDPRGRGGPRGGVSARRMLARGRRLLRCWKPLFTGRLLLLTNTASCGALLATGDMLQQAWHRRRHPDTELQVARTGDNPEREGDTNRGWGGDTRMQDSLTCLIHAGYHGGGGWGN